MENTMALSNYQASPGVYIKEYDISAPVLTESKTIGVIVGASAKGPVNERTLISSTQEFINVFGPPNPKISMMHYAALTFLEESGVIYVTRIVGGATALTAGAYLTTDDPLDATPIIRLTVFDNGQSLPRGIFNPLATVNFDPADIANPNTLLFFTASNPGTWNNSLYIVVRPSNSIGTPVGVHHDSDDFFVDVYVNYRNNKDRPVESFLVNRANKIDGYGNQMFIEDVINRKSNLIRVKNNPYCNTVPILRSTGIYLDGGVDGRLPTEAELINGWNLYTDVEQIDVNVLINGGYATPQYQIKMVELAELRHDCVALLDIPSDQQSVNDAETYRSQYLNVDSSYAAIYTPDVKIKDPYNDIEIYIPVSGYAAAICARVDNSSFVWSAPAGLTKGSIDIVSLRHVYNQEARDRLDSVNINMVRKFPGLKAALWAQNTMQIKISSLCNLNVRRLMNYMEKSVGKIAMYSVFETNNHLLRAKLTATVEAFLEPIKANQGFYDYKVICDETNNPVSAVMYGNMIMDIYIDPVLPAKRIHITATITKTGALFAENNVNTTSSGLPLR